jgi:hypothetical protein
MSTIFRFLQELVQQTTLPLEIFQALHRHFYFMQRLSDGGADGHNTFYYEREWRLGEQTLVPDEILHRSNARYWAQKEGYPPYTGRLVKEGANAYFAFNAEDVAFLISPRKHFPKVGNSHGFPIEAYEDLVRGRDGEI